jgi:pimeloyl-ACP methyl ester carboxylesterase
VPLTTINGYGHFYEDVGAGEAVVLLHGILNSSRYFAKLIPDLATDFRVIAPHLRGMGFSERVTELPPTAWASDVIALMDELGIDDAHFYGVSLGAIIAMRLAIELPERVRSLTVDSPVITTRSIPSTGKTRAGRKAPKRVAQELWAMHGEDWRVVQENCDRYKQDPDLWAYLNLGDAVTAITTPTLIIRGDIEEPFHPLMHAIELHEVLPNSWLWIAPHTRSLLARRHPADSLRVFRDFVAESVTTPSRTDDAIHRRRMDLLARVDLFAALGDGELARLAALASNVVLRTGEIVFREGDPADGLYVVAAGSFCVSVSGRADQGEVPVRCLGPGDFFGEMALLTNESRSATVRCESSGELVRINPSQLRALVRRDAATANAVATALSQYVRAHNQALVANSRNPGSVLTL